MTTEAATNEDGLTYGAWMIRLNTAVHEETDYACGIHDLPDTDTWHAWNDGVNPKDWAIMVLEEEGYYDFVDHVIEPEPEPEPYVGKRYHLYTEPPVWMPPEDIVLENGQTVRIQRKANADGTIRVLP